VSRSYILTLSAEADLRGLIRHSRKQWGETQTRLYLARLEQCAEALAKGGGFFKDLSAVHPGLRMVLCQHHYVFCLPRATSPALIIAIFHERMDLMARLKLRLAVL
jgi:toxin ParE1/3/4